MGGQQFTIADLDPRLEFVLPLLYRRCRTLCGWYDDSRRYADERQTVEGEIKAILQTLSAELFEHIRITFREAYSEHALSSEATHLASPLAYDRKLSIPSTVQDIKALQVKLRAIKDEDEQRALEEDITGKILWLFWCGICAEVDQLLPEVVAYIRREGNVKGLLEICEVNPPTDPRDDRAHLQRIMLDAAANISKYQLWLSARARERAKWPGTNRGTPTVDNQATIPSESRQTPSTSAV